MRPHLIYDLPTRLFHWLFAGLFVAAFAITQTIDDDSPRFAWHMLIGLTLVATVLLRLVWAVVGTRHARFADFSLHPAALFTYMKGLLSPANKKWPGHNPASSWAAVVMMGLALGLGVTGYLMTTGGENGTVKELHELIANSFLVIALLHVAGVIFHGLRHRDGLGLSMVDGRKAEVPAEQAIASAKPWAAALFVFIIAVVVTLLVRNYNPSTQTLNLAGMQLQLGEVESEGESEGDKNNAATANSDSHEAEDDHDDH